MRNYRRYVLAVAILFTVSASISLWLQNRHKNAAKSAAKAAAEAEAPAPEAPLAAASGSIQGAPNASDREKAVSEREQALTQRQQKMALIDSDIRSERAALEELRKQIREELRQASQAAVAPQAVQAAVAPPLPPTSDFAKRQEAAARDEAEIRKAALAADNARANDYSRLAATYNGLPANQVAFLLQQMAMSGRKDDAARVLTLMKGDVAEKVIAEVASLNNDLALQFNSQIRNAQGAPPAPPAPAPPAVVPAPPAFPGTPAPPM